MSEKQVEIRLTSDEALVLLELVTRFTNDDTLTIEHGGERAALWNLCAALERVLVEPFQSNYQQLLSAARSRLAEQAGTARD